MEIKFTSKFYLPLLIVSIVLFITVFFPWLSVSAATFGSFTTSGMHNWGVLTLIMSLVGVELAFITPQKIRTIGSIIAGILALLGVILYWTTDLNGAGIGFGLVIALIVAIAYIAIGVMDHYQIKLTPRAKN